MRTVSLRLADLPRSTIPIGFMEENLHTQVRFDCLKMFEEYPDAIASLAIAPPNVDPYPAVVTRDGDWLVWDVQDSDLTKDVIGELQLTFTVGNVVAKSYIGKYRVTRSIAPNGSIPTPIQNWITQANTILAAVDAMGREF